jgi:mannose-1-phosphate guanylyltransferase
MIRYNSQPMIWHPLAALARIPDLTEVYIVGFYEDALMTDFIRSAKKEFPKLSIR